MILFRIYDLFTINVYEGNEKKTSKYTKSENKGKNSPFDLPSPPSTKMVADCFPVSEKTEIKPGLL